MYAGAAAGIFASVVIAFALQALFPAVSSGTNREILEGFVGIFCSYNDDWGLDFGCIVNHP